MESETKKLEEAGQYQKIIEANKKQADMEKAALINKMAVNAIPILIKAAAAKIPNLAAGALNDLPDLLDKHLALDADTFTVRVVDGGGKLVLDQKTGKPVDPDEFVQGFIKDRPHLLADNLPVRHGLIPSSKAPGSVGIMEMSDEDAEKLIATDPLGYTKAVQAEFTHQKVVQRARQQGQRDGWMALRGGAAK